MATCHWHPEMETGLTCGSCERPICTECLRQHPVGIRCKECARSVALPTYQLSTTYYMRASGAMLGLGVAGGLGLLLVGWIFPFGFFRFLVMLGLGYLLGEGLSAAVNRKRGRALQYMAGAAVFISVALAFLLGDRATVASLAFLWGGAGFYSGIFGLVGIAIAVAMAASRLRR